MMNSLENTYKDLESHYVVVNRPELATKVVASENYEQPIHGWFRMKEAYSPTLVAEGLAKYKRRKSLTIADPFLGSGTTGIAALQWGLAHQIPGTFLGSEINPFLATLSRGKLAAQTRGSELADQVRSDLGGFVKRFRADGRRTLSSQSSTLNKREYFSEASAIALESLGAAALEVQDPDSRALFQIAIASAIEPSSMLRRDGRALRFVASRVPENPRQVALRTLRKMLQDMDSIEPSSTWRIRIDQDAQAIGRSLDADMTGSVDWTVFSPPYPNNIDYTEVYKLENWILGGWNTSTEMLAQRRRTLRSHPTAEYSLDQLQLSQDLSALTAPLVEAVPADKYRTARINTIRGYVLDMHAVLENARRNAKKGGRLTYVVGNSLHGSGSESFVIAADLLIASVATACGWRVDEIQVARRLHRRHSESVFLRESVVECVAV